jgi:hypothetical protein
MTVPQLSIELLEMVIDQVVDDQQWNWQGVARAESFDVLRSCALTCSALRPRAHHHLYALITIAEPTHAANIAGALRKRPDLVQNIKTLVVHTSGTELSWMCNPNESWLLRTLPLFTHTTSLVFISMNFTESYPQSVPLSNLLRSIPASVRQVTLTSCRFQDDSALVDIIRSITHLRSFELNSCRSMETSTLALPSLPPISPESLTVISYQNDIVISQPWIQALSFSSLTALTFNMWGKGEVAPWQAVLASAPLIRDMTIRHLGDGLISLDLGHQRALHTLRVPALWWRYDRSTDPMGPFCVLLSTTRSRALSHSEVTFYDYARREHLDLIDWANLKHAVVDSNVTWVDVPKLVITFDGGIHTKSQVEEPASYMADKKREMEASWLQIKTQNIGYY